MNLYPIWLYFVSMAALLWFISFSVFSATDKPSGRVVIRQSNIDGLRGFLAFGVVFFHGALFHDVFTNLDLAEDGFPKADGLPSAFLFFGQGGVALFFMITGYLFWKKLLKEHGRPDWLSLYIGRVFRIGPLYFIAIALMLLLVAIRSDFTLRESLQVLFKEISPWLILGLGGNGPDINGHKNTFFLLTGVIWTLAFEWKFYFSLLVMSFVARNSKVALVAVLAAFTLVLVYCLVTLVPDVRPFSIAGNKLCALFFLCGMLTAALEENGRLARWPRHVLSALCVVILVIIPLFFITVNSPVAGGVLGVVFYFIVSGADLFGLLSSAPARRLGNVSFGIYLLQGIVFAIVFSFKSVVSFALISPAYYWAVICGCATVLLCSAACLHVLVELPGIGAGKRIASRFASGKKLITANAGVAPSKNVSSANSV